MKSHDSRSFGLDLVRAFAIFLVLLSHFAQQFEVLGFWGVELFFGLSGFLIGQILWRNFSQVDSWKLPHMMNFWSRRWWRTLPNYYLFFLISLVAYRNSAGQFPSASTLFRSLLFSQDFLTYSGGFYAVSWSLCVEEWFYLLFPFLLFIVSKSKLSPKVIFALTLVVFFAAFTSIRSISARSEQANFIRYITMCRLDAIACGVLVAYISSIIVLTLIQKRILFAVGVILLFSPVVVAQFGEVSYRDVIQNQFLLILVPLGASFILPVVALAPTPQGIFTIISTMVKKMSLWSYSIYLSHIPVLFTVYELMSAVRGNPYGNLASKIIGLALTVALSALIFQYFELPLTRRRPAEIVAAKT